MPSELKPNWIEKISILSSMFKFSFLLILSVVVGPIAYIIMPGGGGLGIALRAAFIFLTFILAEQYTKSVRDAYFKKVSEHMKGITEEIKVNLPNKELIEDDSQKEQDENKTVH